MKLSAEEKHNATVAMSAIKKIVHKTAAELGRVAYEQHKQNGVAENWARGVEKNRKEAFILLMKTSGWID